MKEGLSNKFNIDDNGTPISCSEIDKDNKLIESTKKDFPSIARAGIGMNIPSTRIRQLLRKVNNNGIIEIKGKRYKFSYSSIKKEK